VIFDGGTLVDDEKKYLAGIENFDWMIDPVLYVDSPMVQSPSIQNVGAGRRPGSSHLDVTADRTWSVVRIQKGNVPWMVAKTVSHVRQPVAIVHCVGNARYKDSAESVA